MGTIYGCFVKFTRKGWHFSHFAKTSEERDSFVKVAENMIESRMLGDTPIAYKIVELD